VPKLLSYETTPLHDVPTTLPANFQSRPELDKLRDALVSATDTDVTGIAGMPGLGKTTTATWLALDSIVRNAYRDGIFWLEFGQKRTAEQQLSRLATLLGVPDGDLARREQRGTASVRHEVARRLKDKRCLIILDDVWNEAQPTPFQWLAGGHVKVLMTTRKGLIVEQSGEKLARLELSPLDDASTMQLLVLAAGRVLPGPPLAKLVNKCAGLPAMAQSLGRMCSVRSADEVVTWLDTHKLHHRLPKMMAAAKGYQQDAAKGNIFLAFEGQLNGLEAEGESELVKRCTMLAIFPEDTDVPVGVLSDLWGLDAAETIEVVERLAYEYLIVFDYTCSGSKMIRLLDPVRDYLGCRGKNDLACWHARLLGASTSTSPTEVGGGDELGESGYYWNGNDGYHNFMHHLDGCNGELGVGMLGDIECLNFFDCGADDAGVARCRKLLEACAKKQKRSFEQAFGPNFCLMHAR